jgi:hypothetical protein
LLVGVRLRDAEASEGGEMATQFKPGDLVVYHKHKFSVRPGRHAKEVCPAAHGDSYSYSVEKLWRVVAVQPDHQVVLCTRRGKRHTVAEHDPALRRAHWWERLLFRHRFPPPTPA